MRGSALFWPATKAGVWAAACVCSPMAFGFGGNNGTVCPTPVGPDVIVGDIQSDVDFTAEEIPAGSGNWYDAFSFGTTSCNVGNQNVLWQAFPSNQHPAIAQNLYKLNLSGTYSTIEQIGMSWLKHGFTALTQNICGCGCNNQGGSVLGVGCSDPYTAARNATQGSLGPRWQVNAHTGFFPTGGPANPSWSGTTARRLRVKMSDIQPSSAGIHYYAECQYVSQHDSSAGNQNNNVSYRQCNMTVSGNNATVAVTGITQRTKPAIRAWKINDPTVVETDLQIPGEGLFIIAADATDLGNGMWHYEYAVYNMNSDHSGQAFSVPLPEGAVVTNIGFHDVDYHSNDGINNITFSGADWTATVTDNAITWATQTFAENANANALRWGTMYNFRFDANKPPASSDATLTTFKVVANHVVHTIAPAADCNENNVADVHDIAKGTSNDANTNGIPDECENQQCEPDINNSGSVDVADLLAVIAAWGPCDACPADVNGSGAVDVADLLAVINAWGACP